MKSLNLIERLRHVTRLQMLGIVLGATFLWYIQILVVPACRGNPNRILKDRVWRDLRGLGALNLDVDGIGRKLANIRWRDRYNEYTWQIVDATNGNWSVICKPEKSVVDAPLWRKVFFLDFSKEFYATYRIDAHDQEIHIIGL